MTKTDGFFGSVRRFFRDYVDSLAARGPFGQLVLRAMHEPELRQSLLNDTDATLAEAGVRIPAGMRVRVLENSDKVIHIVLPPLVTNETEGQE